MLVVVVRRGRLEDDGNDEATLIFERGEVKAFTCNRKNKEQKNERNNDKFMIGCL